MTQSLTFFTTCKPFEDEIDLIDRLTYKMWVITCWQQQL